MSGGRPEDLSRIEELERIIADLRRRLLGLAQVLPSEYLPYLDPEAELDDAPLVELFADVDDSTNVTSADVAGELEQLWKLITPERT